ncbi:MAG: hypothetical protein J0L62_08385 [Bacteroidetes bacterium]|nr:hypothetical protein [Bacteroidota bacterium]
MIINSNAWILEQAHKLAEAKNLSKCVDYRKTSFVPIRRETTVQFIRS